LPGKLGIEALNYAVTPSLALPGQTTSTSLLTEALVQFKN